MAHCASNGQVIEIQNGVLLAKVCTPWVPFLFSVIFRTVILDSAVSCYKSHTVFSFVFQTAGQDFESGADCSIPIPSSPLPNHEADTVRGASRLPELGPDNSSCVSLHGVSQNILMFCWKLQWKYEKINTSKHVSFIQRSRIYAMHGLWNLTGNMSVLRLRVNQAEGWSLSLFPWSRTRPDTLVIRQCRLRWRHKSHAN